MALSISDGDAAILTGLANGKKRGEIATDLGFAVSTVNNRIHEAVKRNNMRTSYQLLAWFVRDAVLASVRAQEGPAGT